jgi:hypothetical protein
VNIASRGVTRTQATDPDDLQAEDQAGDSGRRAKVNTERQAANGYRRHHIRAKSRDDGHQRTRVNNPG